MGRDVDRERFDPADYARFSERLRDCLKALEQVLRKPGFGAGESTIGAELELVLVDGHGRPLPANQKILAETLDPRLTYELDRFDIECNLRPVSFRGRPFSALGEELRGTWGEVDRAAKVHGGSAVAIGILPAFRPEDFGAGAMSDVARYRALSAAIRRRRGAPFQIRIDGPEPLATTAEDVSIEGANTSFQVHLRVEPRRFAAAYNAAQLATPVALSVAGNSPTFLGHRLWQETRIALFKQATDDRRAEIRGPRPRVAFGKEWLTHGAEELFAHLVEDYTPVLPLSGKEEPLACLERGDLPSLPELRLHAGTVWLWNRPVYDPCEEGHLRIEFRALPAGPTEVDMLANAAFLLGLTLGFEPHAGAWTRSLPFATATHNFYRAAQWGLRAEFLWPAQPGEEPHPVQAGDLVLRLLPLAEAGLCGAGVEREEARCLLETVRARVESGQTGAVWQENALDRLERGRDRSGALEEMLFRYRELSRRGEPVHRWNLPDAGRAETGRVKAPAG